MANDTIVDTPLGLAHPSSASSGDKALCHPHRPMAADGLCESCVVVRGKVLALSGALEQEATEGPLPLALTAPTKARQTTRQALVDLYRMVDFANGVAEVARAILVHSLPRHAELLLEAAEVAAKDGDSRPMQFALQYAKMLGGKTVVDPPEKGTPGVKAAGGSGVKVLIGVQMGSMPAQSVLSAQVVEAEPVEET